ncbi:hypothetical protein FNZ56_09215 [Pseudoluteimonas lycopersici]|uniref:Spore coat protein U domain-containing protein n=1 Tax=Pseudoluteimonas lycopersici TaxID=1324796 RepID=A0A516V691_9GAMM|nr:hypothetical protein [Lysobacter lycopersici]QDQ74045.1 hypothetical protein FNZ56_09215 [Lysobacter lycopersici]
MPSNVCVSMLACALVAGSLALPARAATQAKTYEFPAADACQLSVPTTDTKVRPRANGYRNEGTSNQFVICGMGGYENDTVMSTTLLATSVDGQAHSMTCTGVTGLAGFDGPYYSAKTVTVPSSGVGTQSWAAADFGGTEGEVIAGGLNLSVTCTLPPNVALQGFESQGIIDVGN